METNLKKSPQKRLRPKNYSRLLDGNRLQQAKSIEYSNIRTLKNRQTDLMRSTTKALSSRALTTRPSTNPKKLSSGSEQSMKRSEMKEISDFKIQLQEIKVSEFKENVPSSQNVIKYHKQMPPIMTKSINKGTKVSHKGNF